VTATHPSPSTAAADLIERVPEWKFRSNSQQLLRAPRRLLSSVRRARPALDLQRAFKLPRPVLSASQIGGECSVAELLRSLISSALSRSIVLTVAVGNSEKQPAEPFMKCGCMAARLRDPA
jgi:hypothetical protein